MATRRQRIIALGKDHAGALAILHDLANLYGEGVLEKFEGANISGGAIYTLVHDKSGGSYQKVKTLLDRGMAELALGRPVVRYKINLAGLTLQIVNSILTAHEFGADASKTSWFTGVRALYDIDPVGSQPKLKPGLRDILIKIRDFKFEY